MQKLQLAGQQAENMFDGGDYWVEWVHPGTAPATTATGKAFNTMAGVIKSHCPKCLNLNGCRFLKSKMPEIPLHENCHCYANPIAEPNAAAECDLRKFTDYIFNSNPLVNKGKKALFESWGYDIMSSERLQAEFIKQAQEKYAKGEYELDILNDYGQRIDIEIILSRNDGKADVSFISGWMVYPDGTIKLTTPYGGI